MLLQNDYLAIEIERPRFSLTVVHMMFILLTWCEFQKYALTSLQQLLADHPPAPEGLDPDIGTVVNKYLCLFCFVFLWFFFFLSLLVARKDSISPITLRSYLQKHYVCIYIYIFSFGGGGRGGE